MDLDLLFIGGIIMGVFSIPSLMSAYSDGRPPRLAAVVLALGVISAGYAIREAPGEYSFDKVPDVFVRVVANYF